MARIRTIKPTFWSDEKIGLLPRDVRLTFLGLISAMADDHGRLVGNARIVRGAVYPYDDDVTVADVERHLTALAQSGRIQRYEVNGDDYIAIPNWSKHQKVDKPSKSLLPAPLGHNAGPFDEPSSNDRGTKATDGKREEGSGGELEESGAEEVVERTIHSAPIPALRSDEDPRHELASLLAMLPREAHRILETFYEPALTPASRERWRNVAMQLVDTMDPKHAGPKIRGGQRVKARSAEHMSDVCRSVLKDPPMNRDAAIVFVLQKLLDPPKGPSVTERAKREEDSRVQLEERYHAELRIAAKRWAHEHPDEYAPIAEAVENTYRGRSGVFAKSAKESELAQKCAERAAFPAFDVWLRNQPPHARSA